MDIAEIKNIIRKKKDSSKTLLLGSAFVMVGLTYRCQCSCPHCGIEKQKLPHRNELSAQEIFKILHDCISLGTSGIYFFGGEPLLVPEITEYITFLQQHNVFTSLDTNAYLLDQKMAKSLKKAGLTAIRISIDSPDENTHDNLRGLPGLHKKAIKALDICRDLGIITYISTYATKENLKNGEIEGIISIAKKHGIKIRILSPICSGKWGNKKNIVLSKQEILKLQNLLEEDIVIWENTQSNSLPFTCKSSIKELLYISPYGDVQPCCFFSVQIGNALTEPIESIVKRMWSLDFFNSPYKGDCPVNSEKIIKKYHI